MIVAAVNKEFGVLAVDSLSFDEKQGETLAQKIKLFYTDKYLLAYTGTPLYFANIKREKLGMDFLSLIVYLENYLKRERPIVGKMMKSELVVKEKVNPYFSLFLMGIHKKLPTVAQFNSDFEFKPKYLYSDKETKFSTSDAMTYMEEKLKKIEKPNVGLVAEILARGIYKKSENSGIVNAAGMKATGEMIPLSGTLLA